MPGGMTVHRGARTATSSWLHISVRPKRRSRSPVHQIRGPGLGIESYYVGYKWRWSGGGAAVVAAAGQRRDKKNAWPEPLVSSRLVTTEVVIIQ